MHARNVETQKMLSLLVEICTQNGLRKAMTSVSYSSRTDFLSVGATSVILAVHMMLGIQSQAAEWAQLLAF
jgi:hypothetical protein